MNLKYIIFIPILFIIIVTIVLTNYFISFEHKVLSEQLNSIENRLILKNKNIIKNDINYLVNIVSTNAKYFKKLEKNKLEDFTKQLFQDFNNAGKGYIFAYDHSGKTIFHVNKTLINTNRWNLKIDNKYMVQDIIKYGQKTGGSFVEYKATVNPNSKTDVAKISYVNQIKELNWIIGTGFYTQKLQKDIQNKRDKLHKEFKKDLNKIIFTITPIVVILVLLLWYILNKVSNRLINSRKKLENSVDNFQQLIDVIMETVIITNKDRNIIDINNAGVKLLKYNNKNELIGKNIIDFIPDHELNKFKEHILQDIAEPYELDIKVDDEILKTLSCGRNIIRDNETIRISSVVDLTEIKTKDKLIQQQSKMATMGDMIGNIAHQWRQPLNVVGVNIMKLELLNDINYNDKEIQTIADNTNKSLQYMSKTIDDFRNFFAIKKDKDYFFIEEVTEEAKSIINTQLIDLNINLNIENNCKKLEIFGYKNELLQVILNILNNAKDAIMTKKQKDLFDGEISIKVYCIDNNINIDIQDNAGGIPKDIISKIFDPYFTTKFKSKGTGLGLYMSKIIIETNMNGSLLVSNDINGAKFTISLKKNNEKSIKC